MPAEKKMRISEEAARCLLCKDAKCSAACPKGFFPDRAVRSVRFENIAGAADFLNTEACAVCSAPCEEACVHYDRPIRIKEIAVQLQENAEKPDYTSLETVFCGVKCKNPFFLSSSVVASSYEMCARALEAGWGGIVFKTIGMFPLKEVSPRFDATSKEGTKFVGFKNLEQIAEHPLQQNLDDLKRLKENYPDAVIISSIMGQNDEEWTELARLSEEAGVDIIECNFSCPHMSADGLGSAVGEKPELVSQYIKAAKKGTKLPVLAKMTPNITHIEIPAAAAVKAGADGLAAINTIKSVSAVKLDTFASLPDIDGKSSVSGYSGKAVKPIALRFIHEMAVCGELSGVPISGMGGIETWRDAAEFIALGCGNLQITTAVMQYGYRIIDDLLYGLSYYLGEKGYKSVSELIGKALPNIVPADTLDRETVVFPVFEKDKCVGCGRCFISCEDAGHQAIDFSGGMPKLLGKKCVGCHLCRLVCPAEAIKTANRVPKPKN